MRRTKEARRRPRLKKETIRKLEERLLPPAELDQVGGGKNIVTADRGCLTWC
jgi:hypothetical protein